MRIIPSFVCHGDVNVVMRFMGLAELEGENHSTVDRDWKAAVTTAEHHRTDDELGKRVESAGE